MLIRPFTKADTDDVVALWTASGLVRPWNDPRADIRRKLTVQPELFLVAVEGPQLVGTVMAGYDGHRGSIYYLAVDPAHKREGIGRALLVEVERLLADLGCPNSTSSCAPTTSRCWASIAAWATAKTRWSASASASCSTRAER